MITSHALVAITTHNNMTACELLNMNACSGWYLVNWLTVARRRGLTNCHVNNNYCKLFEKIMRQKKVKQEPDDDNISIDVGPQNGHRRKKR